MQSNEGLEHSTSVAIVGAGCTGLLTALLLARRSHRVALIERWPEPYPLPRAVGMAHESVRALEAAGVIDEALPLLEFVPPGGRVIEVLTGEGEIVGVRQDPAESISGWPARATFCQPELERVLNAAVERHPAIEVFRGWEVDAVDCDADGAVVGASPFPESESARLTVRADFVVGSDGANSAVRESQATAMLDIGFASDWLVVDVVPRDSLEIKPDYAQILGPPRPVTVVHSGPGRRRWEFMRLEGESIDELNRPDTAWRLLEPFGVDERSATLERHAVYSFGSRWARSWYRDGIVLAGDAAHVMPPFLGEGFNSGLRDAASLAWHLDLILRGIASPALLQSYSEERIGQVSQIVRQAVDIGRLICTVDPAEAEARNEHMRRHWGSRVTSISEWRLGPGTWLAEDPVAGFLGVHGRVADEHSEGRFDQLVGTGSFVLLGMDEDPAEWVPASMLSSFAQLKGICVHLGEGSALTDADGTYAAWFASVGAAVALVRPDNYVFGVGATMADAPRLVGALLDMITGGTRPRRRL